MKELPKDAQNIQKTVVTAKRMTYVRSVVRLLKGCDAKLHQLMATRQGQEMFHQACMGLLTSIESCFTINHNEDASREATNLLLPIFEHMAIPESTAKLFADAIGLWQTSSQTGNIILCSMLCALKFQKQWTLSVYQVLESTLLNYMRVSGKFAESIHMMMSFTVEIFNQICRRITAQLGMMLISVSELLKSISIQIL